MKKTALFLSIIIIFSLLFLVVSSKDDRFTLRQKGSSFMEGMRIVHKKAGKEDWRLFASRADISRDGERADLTGLVITIKEQGMQVSSDRGMYDMKAKRLTVAGKILAQGSSVSIESSGIDFDSLTGDLKSSGKVRINGKKYTIEGAGMNIENNGQKMRITRDVKATFYN